jgi:membrane-bound ClpP family serine protease
LTLGGQHVKSPVDGVHALLINTAGLALVLVGLMLIYAAGNLKERMGIPVLNGIARLIFSVLLVYYLIAEDIARILLLLALIGIVIAGAFFYHVYRIKMIEKTSAKPILQAIGKGTKGDRRSGSAISGIRGGLS